MNCCKGGDGGDAPERVFGAEIARMLPADLNGDIPKVLKECAAFVRSNGMTTQGIFRRSANASKLKEVKIKYNTGESVDFEKEGGVHLAANVIKTFLRDLRIPLMGFSIYPIILKTDSSGNLGERVAGCRDLFTTHLPGRNLTILRALVVFLGEVTKQADNNGMTGSNVAIVFGPNLFWGKGAGPTSGKIPSVEEMNKVSAFTQFMFDNSEELFTNMSAAGYSEATL